MKKNTDINLYIFIILVVFFILAYIFLDYFIELGNSWHVIKNRINKEESNEKLKKRQSIKIEKKK